MNNDTLPLEVKLLSVILGGICKIAHEEIDVAQLEQDVVNITDIHGLHKTHVIA